MIEQVFASLKSFVPPDNWKADLFLLPEDAMNDIAQFVKTHKLHDCIELGTGFGATSCMIGAALEEVNEGGTLLTIDKYLHQPVNVKVLKEHAGLRDNTINVVTDELGYNWYLPELIRQQTHDGVCTPLFDFCLLDGAHEWEPDALAFTLVAKLLKPGAWIAIDDINYFFKIMPNWKETHGHYTEKELETYQMKMVYEIVVQQHPDFCDFHLTHDGRIGWARKKTESNSSNNLFSKLFSRHKS